MSQSTSFWAEQNTWWAGAVGRMTRDAATDSDWEEAERHIRALIGRVEGGHALSPEATEDLAQAVLLRLCQPSTRTVTGFKPGLLFRMRRAHAPAHYLRRVVQRLLINQTRRERRARASRSAEKYAELVQRLRERDPAREAERAEAGSRVRFIVNHVLDREDREILGLRYFDGKSCEEIAAQLKLSNAAVRQRLFRAKEKFRQSLSNLVM